MIRAASDLKLREMTKTSTVCILCARWPRKEYWGDISGSRNVDWKSSQYSLQRFEHDLPLPTLGSENANFWSKLPYQAKYDEFGAFVIFPGLVTAWIFPFPWLKRILERQRFANEITVKIREDWQRYWKMIYRKASESSTIAGRSVKVLLWRKCFISRYEGTLVIYIIYTCPPSWIPNMASR